MGIIFKVTAHGGHKALGKHLIKKDANESVKLLGKGINSKTSEMAMHELHQLSLDASLRGTSRTLLHVSISPDKTLSDNQWKQAWHEYEKEFKLEGQPFMQATHSKRRANGDLQEHKHRVYASVDMNNGTVVNLDCNMQRQEYLARKLEHEFGHDLTKGAHNITAHNIAIERGDESTAKAIADAGLMEGDRGRAVTTTGEHQQQQRTGITKSSVLDVLANVYGKAVHERNFVALLGMEGLHPMQGDKTVVLLDKAGGVHPLPRYLNQLKKEGRIASVDRFDLVNNWQLDKLEPGHTPNRKAQRIDKNNQTERAIKRIEGKKAEKEIIRQVAEFLDNGFKPIQTAPTVPQLTISNVPKIADDDKFAEEQQKRALKSESDNIDYHSLQMQKAADELRIFAERISKQITL